MTDHTPTTDLVRHGRAAARGLEPTAPGTSRLLSELADEVDRLRGINERLIQTSLIQERRLEGERDAARAALGRLNVVHRDLREAWDTARENEDWS